MDGHAVERVVFMSFLIASRSTSRLALGMRPERRLRAGCNIGHAPPSCILSFACWGTEEGEG